MTSVSLSWVVIHLNAHKFAEEDAIPNIEKKNMNPAEIWTTLRLPTRVSPNSPAFWLNAKERKDN